MQKKRLYLVNIMILLSFFVEIKDTLALVKPTKEFYVNDYANILSGETENFIIENGVELNNKTGAQIVVVTIKSLEGETIDDYAYELFNNYEIGDNNKNNGILILLSLDEREFRIVVGSGIENYFTEEKIGDIQDDYMVPYFKKDKFDEGMLNGYKAFYQEVSDYYDISTDIKPSKRSSSPIENVTSYLYIFKLVLSFIILCIDVSSSSSKKYVFIFLEILTIIISKYGFVSSQLTAFGIGTLINFSVVNFNINSLFGSSYGRSRYRSHSSSGGYSGGGGSTSGSGSTRKF